MKKSFIIILLLVSVGLFAQNSGLDMSISGGVLIDPYSSSKDKIINGQFVRDFSTGYSNLESSSVLGAIEADYSFLNKDWLHLRGELSFGRLSASNEYQYYNTVLSTLSAGAGVDVFYLLGLNSIEDIELQVYIKSGLVVHSSKMWFTLDNSLQNVVSGFSPFSATGVQFKYNATEKLYLSTSPEVNIIASDSLDGWDEEGLLTTFFNVRLGIGIHLN